MALATLVAASLAVAAAGWAARSVRLRSPRWSDAALQAFSPSADAHGGDQSTATAGFRAFIDSIGTPTMAEAIADLTDAGHGGHVAACASGVSPALMTVGVAALVVAVLCWLPTRDRAPLTSV